MQRISNTDKWKDDWFLELSPYAKLVFNFLCDNCDEAGFYSLSANFMSKQIKIEPKEVVEATKTLVKGVLFSSDRKMVWVKNFIFHQDNLPLEKGNQEHEKIKILLERKLDLFDENKDMLFILNKAIKGNSKKLNSSKFKAPSLKEMETFGLKYAEEKGISIPKDLIEQLFNHYSSNGWKVGGKTPMKNWEFAIRNAILREVKKQTPTEGNDRIDKIVGANQDAKNIQTD